MVGRKVQLSLEFASDKTCGLHGDEENRELSIEIENRDPNSEFLNFEFFNFKVLT